MASKSNGDPARTLEHQFDGDDSPLALVRRSPENNFTGLLTAVESPANEDVRERKRARVASLGVEEGDGTRDVKTLGVDQGKRPENGQMGGGSRAGEGLPTFNLMGAAITHGQAEVRTH